MSAKKQSGHGGERANAGRKAVYNETTKAIRVPESQVDFIKNWLLDNLKTNHLSDATPTLKAIAVQANPHKTYRIPLVTERVAAGFPSPAQDHVEHALDLNEYLIRNESATFIVKANSLSMLGAGIDIDDRLT